MDNSIRENFSYNVAAFHHSIDFLYLKLHIGKPKNLDSNFELNTSLRKNEKVMCNLVK